MVILVYYVLAPVVYLMGARGTFGFLKRKNWGVMWTRADECEHGYSSAHANLPCHAEQVHKNGTQVWRTFSAFLWPAWMVPVFLYKVVTARW